MSIRTATPPRFSRAQSGAAFIVMLVIIVLGIASILVNTLTSHSLRIEQEQETARVLAQAKEALIGFAAKNTNRPGELPCPDVNNDGTEDYVGSTCVALLGRLPWKTLGLPELRDASGETLWYALSDPFHANAASALNSDTAGTLSVSGNLTASNVIAIVFAPGSSLANQDRSTANKNSYSHYLESVVTPYTAFKIAAADDKPNGNYSYNDQMALITHDSLLKVIEKAVARHFKNAQVVETYHSTWGALPFATASKDTYGLLPINGNASLPTWSNIASIGEGGNDCSFRTSTSSCTTNCISARCKFSGLSVGDVVKIKGTLNNVGMGFWRPYDPTTGFNGTSECTQEVCVRLDSNGRYYPANSVMDNVSISASLDSLGHATITFTGKVKSWWYIPDRIQFSTSGMPDYSSTLLGSWFVDNDWQDVMYYAVSPGYVPGASNACTPLSAGTPPYCLTLTGNDAGDSIPAAIIMTGSKLSGQVRPSASASDYMESGNATTADFTYENKARDSAFNDHVITVAP